MLVVISPAKKLDMSPASDVAATRPAFLDNAMELAGVARGLSHDDIRSLMGLSDSLAQLNTERFAAFGTQDRKPAALSFAGDTYQGLEARPLDEIEPYRLEMGSRLKTDRGTSLYDYWGSDIANALGEQAQATGATALVNCASQEYFGAVDQAALSLPVITPVFKELKDGRARIVSFFAKKARGAMARFIVQTRAQDPDAIQDFTAGGYRYQPDQSTPEAPVFLRDYPAA